MSRLTEVTFVSDNFTYRLALDFDDAALVQDTIAFDVTAERFGGGVEFLHIAARVEIKPAENRLVVKLGGQDVYETDILGGSAEPVEDFIQGLPPEIAALFGIDPIMACAVKAGISAIIGQAIDCARRLERNQAWRVVANFFRCMGERFGQISKTTLFRAFRCIYELGV